MKVEKLIQAKGVFVSLARMKVPPKLAYKILKFIRSVEVEEKFFNTKIREIIDEYVAKDEQGKAVLKDGNIVYIEGKEEEGNLALTELNNTEVDAPDIFFTLDELSSVSLSVVDMTKIESFIKEG